jgi:hypothetical protein
MLSLVLVVALGQGGCPADAEAAIASAASLARSLDLAGAAARLEGAAPSGCIPARVAVEYWRGLQAARDAYRTGGDAASLRPVEAAIARLEQLAMAGDPEAEVARIVLLAAAAAAQSERGDMQLMLDQATALEGRLPGAERGLPGITAQEAAGDLWLQVHRFEAARDAYRAAADRLGATPRTMLGLGRVALRLGDSAAACAAYRSSLELLRGVSPPRELEMAEAAAAVATSCAAPPEPAAGRLR